jgi:hypothetical protein
VVAATAAAYGGCAWTNAKFSAFEFETQLRTMVGLMGFEPATAARALMAASGNWQQAVDQPLSSKTRLQHKKFDGKLKGLELS